MVDQGYFNYGSFIKPYGTDQVDDDPFMHQALMAESVMKLFHPDEYRTMRKTAAGITEEHNGNGDEEQKKGTEVHNPTYSKQHLSKKRNIRGSKGKTNLSIDMWKLYPNLTPNYDQIPKKEFTKLLCQANPDYRQQLQQHLSNQNLLSFVQAYGHLNCMKAQLEMENDYWTYVIDKILFAIEWLSQMPKKLTRYYSINWDYPRTKQNIRHRQKITENKLKKIGEQLQVHVKKYSSCWLISDKTLMDQTMPMISDALKVMIENDLKNLQLRFEQKKSLIQYDATDIQLLKNFIDLHPTEDQKVKAAKIWGGKHKFGQRQIRQKKTNLISDKQLNTSMIADGNKYEQEDMDPNHQQYQMPFPESFDQTMRTIIESRRTNMANRTQKIISFQNRSPS